MSNKDDLQPYEPSYSDVAAMWEHSIALTGSHWERFAKLVAGASHRHYLAQVRQLSGLARADAEPTVAQLESGGASLARCGLVGTRDSLMATADSVWRAMQEVAK